MLSLIDGMQAAWRSSPVKAMLPSESKRLLMAESYHFGNYHLLNFLKFQELCLLTTKATLKKHNGSSTLQTPISFGKGKSKLKFLEFYHKNTRGENKYRKLIRISQILQVLCDWFLACRILPQLTSMEDGDSPWEN